jgi:hypothetical protein
MRLAAAVGHEVDEKAQEVAAGFTFLAAHCLGQKS